MKILVGLGNPGPRYDATRHNVGWWALDRIAYDHGFPPFEQGERAWTSEGRVGEHATRLIKPATWMNRSGQALLGVGVLSDFRVEDDLLVLVDDANLDVGRIRLRASGGAGGHNGLESVERCLGTDRYPRLRVGVGRCPEGTDLADWVLAPLPTEDEEQIVTLLPEISVGVRVWMDDGMEPAMNRLNR